MSNTKVQTRISKLFLPVKSQDLVGYYNKQAVERLECRMPNKRSSQLTDFKSYQLNQCRKETWPWPCPSLSWPKCEAQEHFRSVCTVFCTQSNTLERVTARWWKWHTAGGWGKAMILPACTVIKRHDQSQIMNSKAHPTAILATDENFYCEELECMLLNFTLSFTHATRPFSRHSQPCYFFTQNS